MTSLILTVSLGLYTNRLSLDRSSLQASRQEVKVVLQQVKWRVKRSVKLLYHDKS